MLKSLVGLGLVLLLVACQKSPQGGAAHASHANEPAGINWFDGSVDDAFVVAKRENRPVLLYWGAEWCPYCHTVRSTVFNRPDFIAKTNLFVPVYLDGDDAGAQKWGEQFQIAGYPTLIVLDPNQHEIIRLGAGRDVAQYATVLDLALDDLQPVDRLLQSSAAGKTLSLNECRRLALNSWELESLQPTDDGQRAIQLQAAAAHCPTEAQQERALLIVYAADREARAESAALGAPKGMPSPRLSQLLQQVNDILSQPVVAAAAVQALVGVDTDFFNAARAIGPTFSQALRDRFIAVMDVAARDTHYALADQLFFLDAQMRALKGLNDPQYQLPKELLASADARIDAALAAEQNVSLRAGLVDASLTILEDVGDYPKAYQIANAEIARSPTPYYFQADLAEIAEKLGHKEEAVGLLDQAYTGSQGTATRFQWGQLYLSGLLRMTPNDSARIQDAGLRVLGELDGNDRIYRRARMRLERIDHQLRDWNTAAKGSHDAVLQALRQRMQQICLKIPANEPARSSCDSFLRTSA